MKKRFLIPALATIIFATVQTQGFAEELTAAQPAAPASPAATTPGLSLLSPADNGRLQPVVASAKIGLVDLNRISNESAKGKDAQQKIKAQQTSLQKQIDTKRKQLDKFRTDTEKQIPTLSPQQREAKQREFQKKIDEFQKFGVQSEQKLVEQQQKLTKELFDAIGNAATELGKAKGLQAVMTGRELLYSDPGVEMVDLNAELVKLLDSAVKAK